MADLVTFSGGDQLQEKLRDIAENLAPGDQPYMLSVGFLEDATYPDGKSVAYIAAIQEFGATIQRRPGTVTVYRSLNAKGSKFLKKGRFVKKAKANFVTTHAHGAYVIVIPPRPYFRNMIAKGAPHWAADLAEHLRATDYDAEISLGRMGEQMVGELRTSINEMDSPPLAASTVRRKGFSKPLIDTGHMWNSADYRVSVTVPAGTPL